MKGDRLGEFEEIVLLALRGLAGDAYAVPLQHQIERSAGRRVSIGAIYAAFDRLEDKGLLRSGLSDPTPERGGKRKRLFTITRAGIRATEDARRVRQQMWRVIEERE